MDNSFGQKHTMFPVSGIDVDVVFCIDATESSNERHGPYPSTFEEAKKWLRSMFEDFNRAREKKHKGLIDQYRIRIVVFRDYNYHGENAILITDFFVFPQQKDELEVCVNSITLDGGDVCKNGLEALAYAIRSNWTTRKQIRRHVILLWTNADAHELDFDKNSKYYPNGMPQNMSELKDSWDETMDDRAKRLILFAPHTATWDIISKNWDSVAHIPLDREYYNNTKIKEDLFYHFLS